MAFILTPATLSLRLTRVMPHPFALTSVPELDFVDKVGDFAETSTYLPSLYTYRGPSSQVRRLAAATAANGDILAIQPPSLNASWSLNFWGPALHCNNVSGVDRTDILENIGSWSEEHLTPISYTYLSWVGQLNRQPFINGTFWVDPNNLVLGVPVLYIASSYDWLRWSSEGERTNNDTVESFGGWSGFLSNTTLLSCELYNSSYALDFNYTNGVQEIIVTRPDVSQDRPVLAEQDFYFPTGDQERWNTTGCEVRSYSDPHCYDRQYARSLSYQAIAEAFFELLIGSRGIPSGTGTSSVMRTVLTDTDELLFLTSKGVETDVLPNEYASVYNKSPLARSRGPLSDTIEHLFENITISMLSEQSLRYVAVTFQASVTDYCVDQVLILRRKAHLRWSTLHSMSTATSMHTTLSLYGPPTGLQYFVQL